MLRRLLLLGLCFLATVLFSAQGNAQPKLQTSATQSAPTSSTPGSKGSPAKPQEGTKFYQPEGPDPTETIAHEHSVTDMLDVVPIKSQVFHNTRMLRVFLPGNYFSPHNRMRRYPVLYLQDGQNVFDKATSFSGKEWEADETVNRLVSEFKIRPMFIVGIDNTGERRTSEYLPYPDSHNAQFQGTTPPELEGAKYAEFLVKEVMPLLEKRYRLATGPANTGIGGSSYGAVVSLTTALHRPGMFGKLLLESPSLWVGDGKLLNDVKQAKLLPQKIYLGIGTREAGNEESNALILKYFTEMEREFKDKGLGSSRLKAVVEGGGQHDEAAWARRLPNALLFLYGR